MAEDEALALWERARNEDSEAQEQLALRAVRVAHRVLFVKGVRGEDLNDLAQNAYVRVLRAMNDGVRVENFDRFVQWKARGVLADSRRRSSRSEVSLEGEAEPRAGDPAALENVCSRECRDALEKCLGILSETLWKVVELRYRKGLDNHEIASHLGLRPNTVDVRIYRANQKIRACLERKGFGDEL